MLPPSNAGSYFYNYKHTHSVVIHEMAVAGPDTLMLVPMAGCQIGWAWKKYHFAGALEDGSLSLPPPKLLPNNTEPLSYALVGNDAFALKLHLMKLHVQYIPQHGLDI